MDFQYKKQFRKELVEWFLKDRRDLPWRRTSDPYRIWVSEVMLQQTRVETVIPYYERFLSKFPNMEDLAEAEEEVLLKMWEGLGYYSRARNLQAGVREVIEQYGGEVPKNRQEISKLKGVGPYTAGAILSIAYGVPEHAVDGNVMRVLSRVLLIEEDIALPKTKKTFEQAVMELIDPNDPSSFNQGLMELGATICTPTSPKCLICPVNDFCGAYQEGIPEKLPVKTKKVKMKFMDYDVFVVKDENERWLLEKRPEKGLLANMWQFPMIERKENEPTSTNEQLEQTYGVTMLSRQKGVEFKHVFSHITWQLESYETVCKQQQTLPENCRWFTTEELNHLPMPVPMLHILKSVSEE